MSPSAQTAQTVVVWGQNKTENEKGMSGRKQRTKGPESLIEKGESVREGFGGQLCTVAQTRDCCACWLKWVPPATHVSPITSGTASDQPASGREDMPFQAWLLPHSDALLGLSSSAMKSPSESLRVSLCRGVCFSSIYKTFKSDFRRFSPVILSLNIFLGKPSYLWLSHGYWWWVICSETVTQFAHLSHNSVSTDYITLN